MLKLRDYQSEAVKLGLEHLRSKNNKPGLIVAPTGAGKSLIIGSIAAQLDKPCIIVQPSRELLHQNLSKLNAFGGEASIYSASFGKKDIGNITYATIQSLKGKGSLFKEYGVEYAIFDEAHLCPPDKASVFSKFMADLGIKNTLGLTATPFRLKSMSSGLGEQYSQLNMLPRERPHYFSKIVHVVQIQQMIEEGFWSPLSYEVHQYDRSSLLLNSTGADFLDESVMKASSNVDLWPENEKYYPLIKKRNAVGINNNIYFRLQALIEEGHRKSIMCFMDSVENAEKLEKVLNNRFGRRVAASITTDTKSKDRDAIISDFKSGKLNVVINFATLAVGFDAPDVDCVIMGRPTNSLAIMYQIYGRGVRLPILSNKKDCLVIDACDNYRVFGRIEDISIEDVEGYGWGVFSKNEDDDESKLLTGIRMGDTVYKKDVTKKLRGYVHTIKKGTDYDNDIMWFGKKFNGTKLVDIPFYYHNFMFHNMKWEYIKGEERKQRYIDYCIKIGADAPLKNK